MITPTRLHDKDDETPSPTLPPGWVAPPEVSPSQMEVLRQAEEKENPTNAHDGVIGALEMASLRAQCARVIQAQTAAGRAALMPFKSSK